jgi:hypothetical protein
MDSCFQSHLLCCRSGDPNVLTWLESDFQKLLQKTETPQMMARAFSLGLKHWVIGTEGAPQWDPLAAQCSKPWRLKLG